MPTPKSGEQAISDAAVERATGKTWAAWFKLLDKWGAKTKPHKDIAAYIYKGLGIAHWWAQTVTVRYEQERGLRDVGQRRTTGAYEVSIQRTIKCTAKKAYDAFTDPKLLNEWITKGARANLKVGGRYSNRDRDKGEFLILQPGKRLKFTWDNEKHCPGTVVDITFSAKSGGKSVIRLTHAKIKTKKGREDMKGGWSWAMDSQKSFLETGAPIPHDEWFATQKTAKRG